MRTLADPEDAPPGVHHHAVGSDQGIDGAAIAQGEVFAGHTLAISEQRDSITGGYGRLELGNEGVAALASRERRRGRTDALVLRVIRCRSLEVIGDDGAVREPPDVRGLTGNPLYCRGLSAGIGDDHDVADHDVAFAEGPRGLLRVVRRTEDAAQAMEH